MYGNALSTPVFRRILFSLIDTHITKDPLILTLCPVKLQVKRYSPL